MKLITENNAKLILSTDTEWRVAGLELLSPLFCKHATKKCIEDCIVHIGHGSRKGVRDVRKMRSELLKHSPVEFKNMLHREVGLFERRAKKAGQKAAFRPNVFSDVDWEEEFPELFEDYPDVVFYDYTKDRGRVLANRDPWILPNYHLTPSWDEKMPWQAISTVLSVANIAVPFLGPIPDEWNGYPVIPGDYNDLRFLDSPQRGAIVGLRFKGKGRSRPTDPKHFGVPV